MSEATNALYEALDHERAQNRAAWERLEAVSRDLGAISALLAELTQDVGDHVARLKGAAEYTVTCCEQLVEDARRSGGAPGVAELAKQSAQATSQGVWALEDYLRSFHASRWPALQQAT